MRDNRHDKHNRDIPRLRIGITKAEADGHVLPEGTPMETWGTGAVDSKEFKPALQGAIAITAALYGLDAMPGKVRFLMKDGRFEAVPVDVSGTPVLTDEDNFWNHGSWPLGSEDQLERLVLHTLVMEVAEAVVRAHGSGEDAPAYFGKYMYVQECFVWEEMEEMGLTPGFFLTFPHLSEGIAEHIIDGCRDVESAALALIESESGFGYADGEVDLVPLVEEAAARGSIPRWEINKFVLREFAQRRREEIIVELDPPEGGATR